MTTLATVADPTTRQYPPRLDHFGHVARPASVLPAICVALAAFIAQYFLWPEADISWLLSVAQRMNAGEVLYSPDLVEVNLPLILQLNVVAVSASDWLRLEPLTVWRALVGLCAAGSCTIVWRLLQPALVTLEHETRSAVAILIAAALVSLPGVAFGQREHLIVLGIVPYAIAAGVRAQGLPLSSSLAALVGVGLAVGLAIKPHYVLAIPCIELALAAHVGSLRRLVRVETVSAVLLLVLLLLDVLWRFPGFVATALPLATTYYGEYGSAVVTTPQIALLGLAMAVGFIPVVPRPIALHSRLLACGALGAYGGFLAQDQGWPYQILPAQTYAALAIGLPALTVTLDGMARVVARGAPRRRTLYATAVIGLAVLVLVGWTVRRTVRANRGERGHIVEHVAALVHRSWPAGSPRTMAGITLSLFPAFPVVDIEDATWRSRFSCLWLLPGIRAREKAAANGQPEPARTFMESAVVDDFARWHPTIVLVQRGEAEVIGDLLTVPAFRAAWSDYRLAGTTEQIDVFVRTPTAESAPR